MKTIETVGEFELIERFFAPSGALQPPGVVIGPGDDAAVVNVPRTQQLVTTTDTLVEGVHFTHATDPFLLGQKALYVNLSDMAAMAGRPRWYLLSLTLPGTTPLSWVEALAHGLTTAARHPTGDIALIGGNTSKIAEEDFQGRRKKPAGNGCVSPAGVMVYLRGGPVFPGGPRRVMAGCHVPWSRRSRNSKVRGILKSWDARAMPVSRAISWLLTYRWLRVAT